MNGLTTSPSRKPRHWLRRLSIGFGVLLLMALVGVGVGAWVQTLPPFGAGELSGERLARAKANPLYRDGVFANPAPPPPARPFGYDLQMLHEQVTNKEVRVPPSPIPVVPVDAKALQPAAPSPGLRAFWLGHASVYAEIDGVRLLVDPVFSEHASPFEYGPRRFHPPPIALADLPPIDAVLVTQMLDADRPFASTAWWEQVR